VVETATVVKTFAGLTPDLFAGDAMALWEFRTALFEKGRFDPDVFQSWKNFFAVRNIPSLELEARGATPSSDKVSCVVGRPHRSTATHRRLKWISCVFSAQSAGVAARLTRLGVRGRPRGTVHVD
jgi:hypothetical protein